MKRTLGLLLLVACGESVPDPGSPADLVARERAFSALSVDSGIRPAFLAFLADSAVLWRPGPVPGRAYMAGRPNPPGTLAWAPTRAEVAGARDLGWTTGPYTYALDGDTAHGHFVSVWERRDNDPWMVLYDVGISHAAPTEPLPRVATSQLEPVRADAAPAALRVDLLRRDRLVLEAARNNMRRTFEDAYAPNALLYRVGRAPIPLRAERLLALSPGPTTVVWEPTDARVSAAGDLGVSYGTIESQGDDIWMVAPGPNRYLRIWRMDDGRFRIVLELVVGQ